MFRRLKHELKAVGDNIPLVGLSAFLCCIGGILLWVSGGSTWFAAKMTYKPHFTLSLAGVFIVWLLCYGLVGVLLALIWISHKARVCGSGVSLKAFSIVMAVYLLMLSWYAVFFCTRLMLFAVILLLVSIVLCGAVLIAMRRTLYLITVITLLIEMIQIYFVWFSFKMFG